MGKAAAQPPVTWLRVMRLGVSARDAASIWSSNHREGPAAFFF
jgi:hypothetical protein